VLGFGSNPHQLDQVCHKKEGSVSLQFYHKFGAVYREEPSRPRAIARSRRHWRSCCLWSPLCAL
jgi:hypothetical protein